MAAVSRPVTHQDRDHTMTKTNNAMTPVANQPGRPPVRVKLRRVNANLAKAYPPDGENKVWWTRLKRAPRHQLERFCQRLSIAVAGRHSVAMRRYFSGFGDPNGLHACSDDVEPFSTPCSWEAFDRYPGRPCPRWPDFRRIQICPKDVNPSSQRDSNDC
jgi:hypothetical protein